MDQAELTRLGFRRCLPPGHRDCELIGRLESAIVRDAKGWERFVEEVPRLLRQAIDEVIDAPRSRRLLIGELEKTEKTYIGTKIEILLRYHLRLDRGKILDVLVDGIEVDIKNTIRGSWMIPREAAGHPCILISANEKTAKCSFGLVVIQQDILRSRSNQDKKKTISSAGMANVHWLLKDHDYPKNFWEDVPPSVLRVVTNPRGGTERLNLLFRHYLRTPISRATVMALAPQKDTLKRLRKNGGARDRLVKDGIALLSGKYHSDLISKLGLPFCGPSEFISIQPDEAGDLALLRAAGELD